MIRKREPGNMGIGYITDIGNVRGENQDRFLALCGKEDGREVVLCAVADGMGGTENGSLASDYVTGRLQAWWEKELAYLLKQRDVLAGVSNALSSLLLECNEQINAMARKGNISTGTTLSLLCAYEGWIVVKHVGDSRIYMKRQGMWSQLTKDHTWEQHELERGKKPEEDADYARKKGKLVNAMGVGSYCRIDTQIVQIAPNDRYLLCTDGFYRYVNPLCDMAKLENQFTDSQQLLNRLTGQIHNTAATDNFTAVLVDLQTHKPEG